MDERLDPGLGAGPAARRMVAEPSAVETDDQILIIGNLEDSDIAAKGSESQPAARVTIVQRFRQKALCWVFSAAIQVQ